MTIIEAIIFGIIQGLTEFLPISSSGHLVLFKRFFSISGDFVFFSVILHVATLYAVLIYFRKEVLWLIKNPFSKQARKLYIATLPTIVVALIFESFIEATFSGELLPFCFMFTAILLFITHMLSKNSKKQIDNKGAFIIGLMQGIATLPGISRSGTTVSTGILLGYDKEESAKFSFLLSIPIIIASMLYEIYKLIKVGGGEIYPFQTIIAFVISFIVGFFSIKLMMNAVKKMKLYWFSIYLVIVSVLTFLFI